MMPYIAVYMFQLNVSYPPNGTQKLFEIVDEHKLRIFYEKRMGAEVEADSLGDEWKGYVVRVSGGNDKQGFPMKQGVLTNGENLFIYHQDIMPCPADGLTSRGIIPPKCLNVTADHPSAICGHRYSGV